MIDLEPLAAEICRRYRGEFGDEDARYGAAGGAWCIHDNLYLLTWAIDDVRLEGAHFLGNVGWLRRVLESRGFPVERLARNLELASEVVAEAVPDGSTQLVDRFIRGAALVRGDVTQEEPPADAPVRDAYVQALLAARPAAARDVVRTALEAGLTARSIYLDVLQPARHEVGRLWERGQASIAQEHLATATTQALLHHVAGALPHLPSIGRSWLERRERLTESPCGSSRIFSKRTAGACSSWGPRRRLPTSSTLQTGVEPTSSPSPPHSRRTSRERRRRSPRCESCRVLP